MSKLELDEARVILGALFMGIKMHCDFKGSRTDLVEQSLADADALMLAAASRSPFEDLIGQDNPLQKMEARLKSVKDYKANESPTKTS